MNFYLAGHTAPKDGQPGKFYAEFDPRDWNDNADDFFIGIVAALKERGEQLLLYNLEMGHLQNNAEIHYVKGYTKLIK